MALLFLKILLFLHSATLSVVTQEDQNCRNCRAPEDCSSGQACFPETSSRSSSNGTCEALDSPAPCKSSQTLTASGCDPDRSFVYNNTQQQCPFCCIPGLAYRLYSCSPRIQQRNHAVLYAANVSEINSTCSVQSAYSDQEEIVAVSTGWISLDSRALCLASINISAPNGRYAVAKVVTECKSDSGCDLQSSFQVPCPPDAVAATRAVFEALGYSSDVEIVRDITWSIPATGNDTGLSSRMSSKNGKGKIIGATVGSVVAATLAFVTVTWFYYRWKKEQAQAAENQEVLEGMQLELLPRPFRFHDLQKATGKFSSKLGEGGFGSVFKGKLADGSFVAVKRMDIQGSTAGQLQFKAEVISIGSIHHFNLVRLRGFCIHGHSCLLVYEFLENGSLDQWIFHEDKFLDWKTRYSVAVDVARGLSYLHNGCRERILHLDIKPQNILLDERMRARISDFGLSKLAEHGKSVLVSGMRGTPGYMAHEWLKTTVTDKTDVYSYATASSSSVPGVSATASSSSAPGVLLVGLGELARNAYHIGKLTELIDERLLGSEGGLEMELANKFVKIGLWCTMSDPEMRPSMQSVLNMLEGNADVLNPPLENKSYR